MTTPARQAAASPRWPRVAGATGASLGLHLLALLAVYFLMGGPPATPAPPALNAHLRPAALAPSVAQSPTPPAPAPRRAEQAPSSAMPQRRAPRVAAVATAPATRPAAAPATAPVAAPATFSGHLAAPSSERGAERSGQPFADHFAAAYLEHPAPPYPTISRRLGEQGQVVLSVRVGAQGTALAVEVRQSSGFARLDSAALAAVERWRFVAARDGGEAVESSVLVPLRFSLEK